MAKSAPVTHEDSFEARYTANGAMSSGIPTRPSINFAFIGPNHSGDSMNAFVCAVNTNPGESVLHRI
jgi:hypothetical protein